MKPHQLHNMAKRGSFISANYRLLTRIIAFTAIVTFDIRASIKNLISISNANHQSTQQHHAEFHHIHSISSSSNKHQQKLNNSTKKWISFSLHNPHVVPFTNKFVPPWDRCNSGPVDPPAEPGSFRMDNLLPDAFLQSTTSGGHILDFTTTISTNLKILSIGDSVSIQMTESLDEMFGGQQNVSRHLLWETFPGIAHGSESGTICAPTRGGGMHGSWRMTGLLSKKGRGLPPLRNARGGGWNGWQSNWFNNMNYVYEGVHYNTTEERFDVVVYRVMHGWMKTEEITRERIIEAAEIAYSLLGAKTTVFWTAPFSNNVKTNEIMEEVRQINLMIFDVARTWHETHPGSTMLVMDYDMYINQIIWTNARHLGYNVSDPRAATRQVFDKEGPTFLQDRLTQSKWPPSIPMVCAKKPTIKSHGKYCERNMLVNDGMHICTENLAARVGAGLACLLGCVYNKNNRDDKSEGENDQSTLLNTTEAKLSREGRIRACEGECNQQFLSVMPVKTSWVGSNTTLASYH